MASVGVQLIASAVHGQKVLDFRKIPQDKLKESEIPLYEFVGEHVLKYGGLPDPDTVEEDTIFKVPEPKESFKYYMEKTHNRFLQKVINHMMSEVQVELLNKNPAEAASKMMAKISDLAIMQYSDGLVDFRYSEEAVVQAYLDKKKFGMGTGIYTGWETLDDMMGGAEAGDLFTIVGRPASGKTFLLLFMAYYAWKMQGRVPLFISPEMNPLMLQQRLTAVHASKNLSGLMHGKYSDKVFGVVKKVLSALADEELPFWIVDGSKVPTIEDIYLLTRQLNPDAVYYDAAYLMKHQNKRLSKWDRIAESANGLKDLATYCEIPTFASYQFNKLMEKKVDKKTTVTLADIYGSDEIGHLSSVVLGLLEIESVKTLKEREVSVLKGRGGETGKFSINWKFDYMDFSEVPVLPHYGESSSISIKTDSNGKVIPPKPKMIL